MEVLEIIILISAILNFILGLFVYLRSPSRKINLLFGVSAVVTSIWVLTNFMPVIQPTVFWLKSGYAFGALVPLSAILWVLELCEKKITKREIFLLLGVGLLFFVISYSNNLIVANVERVYLGGFEGETGPFFVSYSIYMYGILGLIFYILLSSYYKTKGAKKTQIGYVLIGAILYIAIALIVDFILPFFGIYKLIPLDSPSSIFLLSFTALAITRYHLFGIRVILTEVLIAVIGIVLLIQALTAPTLGLKIFGFVLLAAFAIMGYLLIRYTYSEIRRREEIEKLSEELKIAHVKLDGAYQELERLDKAKSEFISIASHQLRTPLTAIKGYISMILEKTYGKIPGKIKKPLENVYKSNERLTKLVNDLLSVSRIESGRMEMNLEKVALEDIISSVVKELEIKAKEKNIYLKWEKPKISLPKILIDKDKIRQVILNIIDNAIGYTEKGGVTVKVRSMNSEVRIEVSDTGEGMTKEDLAKLFESFSRATAGRRLHIEGAGLGLYIARKFVEMHKGKIWAESPGKDKGSTFYVELPIK